MCRIYIIICVHVHVAAVVCRDPPLDDFDGLFALLVADKLKSCLPEGALDYVLSLEGQDCFGSRKIAELADTYVSNHGERDEPRCTVHVAQVSGSVRDRSPRNDRWQGCTDHPQDGDRETQPVHDVTCFLCNEKGHVVKFCPKKGTRESRPSAKPARVEQRPSDGVRWCYACNSSRHLVRDCPNRVSELHNTSDTEEEEGQVNVCFVECPQIGALATSSWDSISAGVKCSSLQCVNVNGVNCVALIDSGAEMGVVSETVAGKLGVETGGYVQVRGVFGDSQRVPLVIVEVKLCGEAYGEKVTNGKPVVCAVVPFREVTHDMVLPNDVVTDLRCLPVMDVMSDGRLNNDISIISVADGTDDDSDNGVDVNGDQLHVGGCVSDGTEVKQLKERDDSLSAFWEVARAGEGYLEEKIGVCIRFLCHFVWLVCCIWSFCVFMYGSQWGGATAENEAIVWAFSQSGGTICGYQDAMVCRYSLCSMCVKFVSDRISFFIFS